MVLGMQRPPNATSRPLPRQRASSSSDWLIPLGLLALGAIPVLSGVMRVLELSGAPSPMPPEQRFHDQPLPILLHIVGATGFTLAGALQFSPGLRRRAPQLHRVSGWSSVPLGIVAALAGVWMALFFPPAPGVGTTLNVMRLVVGSTMAAFLAAGVVALLRRDFVGHGAWMKRAYALGIAAGTQALVLIPVTFGLGVDTEASYATAMGAGWLLNAGVAEWLIRRQQQRSVRAESPRQQDVFALDRT
jgi:hypothetical protein